MLGQLRSEGLIPSLEAPEFRINKRTTAWRSDSSQRHIDDFAPTRMSWTNDTILVTQGSAASAWVPTNNSLESGAGPHWYDIAFDDASWISGTNGVGYENSGDNYQRLIGTDVRDAWNATNSSVYTRFEFTLDNNFDAASFDGLDLRVKYDDGYVALLNGQVVARRQAPTPATWNSRATSSHSDTLAEQFESVDITDSMTLLRPGDNVLALHILNTSPTSSDLLGLPELALFEEVAIDSAPVVYTLDGTDPRLAGGANVGTAYSGEIVLGATTEIQARDICERSVERTLHGDVS